MTTTYSRGHQIYFDSVKNEWFYVDNNESAKIERACKRCGKMPTECGHDYCLGDLPGVKNACCGHGAAEAYVQFNSGKTIRGKFEI